MPGSATVNCALLWNKQHLFLLISSSLSVSKFVSVGVCLSILSLSPSPLPPSNSQRCSLTRSLTLSPLLESCSEYGTIDAASTLLNGCFKEPVCKVFASFSTRSSVIDALPHCGITLAPTPRKRLIRSG